MASKVWLTPALSVTVMVTVAPSGRSVLPDMVGVVSLSGASVSIDSTGAVVSIMPVLSTAVVLLFASSVAVASTL